MVKHQFPRDLGQQRPGRAVLGHHQRRRIGIAGVLEVAGDAELARFAGFKRELAQLALDLELDVAAFPGHQRLCQVIACILVHDLGQVARDGRQVGTAQAATQVQHAGKAHLLRASLGWAGGLPLDICFTLGIGIGKAQLAGLHRDM